jgi:hypothetical protein
VLSRLSSRSGRCALGRSPREEAAWRRENLRSVLTALRAEGCAVDDRVEETAYGKFGWSRIPKAIAWSFGSLLPANKPATLVSALSLSSMKKARLSSERFSVTRV